MDLPSTAWGSRIAALNDRGSTLLAPFFRGKTDQMPQPTFLAPDATLCQAPDTALVAPAAGSTHPTSGSAQGMAVEALSALREAAELVRTPRSSM